MTFPIDQKKTGKGKTMRRFSIWESLSISLTSAGIDFAFDLENHHASSVFKLLRDKRFNLWSSMTANEYRTFRSLVISLVLATDMANHASLIERISTYFFFKETSPTSNMADSKTLLQTLLHAADISNATKPWSIYIQSAEKIMEEFFVQGDLEKIHCADDKPTFDRESTDIVQLQIGFITHIVHPTVSLLRLWSSARCLPFRIVRWVGENRSNRFTRSDLQRLGAHQHEQRHSTLAARFAIESRNLETNCSTCWAWRDSSDEKTVEAEL